ncbi:NADH dehydrogenase [ubiquinone] 1 beta subcomplex subunit 7 [Procambarus clarkii]|uniref:NADH dehydrogenase [ubiquinone] 1 beta subcomplex subunit 7 n=1 Tax=Procambarus clarkii TaxID=6728 RepID=UPI001E676F65|nr:NADH dehydrogenase [ubiquinone] 1 beta subcomplex subunit 7-like [Procambarus clarkii]
MGHIFSQYLADPAITPDYTKGPTFDPLYGFPEGRKERVMLATLEEMESVQLPLDKRDYCAHLAIKNRACREREWPLVYKCAHEKHEYLNCEYEDYVLRMKEHERERRLLERAKRKAQKDAHEELD